MSAPLQVAVPVPAAVGAGTTKTIIPRCGMNGKLLKADFFGAVTHCTGTSPSCTITVKTGPDNALVTAATAEVGSSYRDTTNVETTLVVVNTAAANISEDTRLTVQVTTAGGTYATGSGFVVFLTVGGQKNPAVG